MFCIYIQSGHCAITHIVKTGPVQTAKQFRESLGDGATVTLELPDELFLGGIKFELGGLPEWPCLAHL